MRCLVESSFIWIFFSGIVASCAGADANYRPGSSDVPPPASSASAAASSSRSVRWERFAQLGSMKELAPTFGSRGHGTGEWNAQIRANDKAASQYDALRVGAAMPQGAVLVELHTDKRGGVPLDGLVMEKREAGYFPAGGDWEYAVISHEGQVQQRGKLEFCARCHADAPADFVFVRPAPTN